VTAAIAPRVEYNPLIHDDLALSLSLQGRDRNQVAAAFGVPRGVLDLWVQRHPSLAASLVSRPQADATVIASLYRLTQFRRRGDKVVEPNVTACIFWCKAVMGMSDQPPPPLPFNPRDMSSEALEAMARDLLRTADEGRIDVTPEGESEDAESDAAAGF